MFIRAAKGPNKHLNAGRASATGNPHTKKLVKKLAKIHGEKTRGSVQNSERLSYEEAKYSCKPCNESPTPYLFLKELLTSQYQGRIKQHLSYLHLEPGTLSQQSDQRTAPDLNNLEIISNFIQCYQPLSFFLPSLTHHSQSSLLTPVTWYNISRVLTLFIIITIPSKRNK